MFDITWNGAFFANILGIIVINLVLSGDNAVLIAMAVRNLPTDQRMKGITFGTAVAVVLRIVLTFFCCLLLEISFVKLVGGFLILWIAAKLFMESEPDEGGKQAATTLWQAIKIILIADLTMSLDNVLAVAGAANGSLFLLIFGITLSIPIVVFTSNLLSMLMDKYPAIIVIGAGILGKVGGEMIITDPFVERWLHPGKAMEYTAQIVGIFCVIVAGKLWAKKNTSRALAVEEGQPAVEKIRIDS